MKLAIVGAVLGILVAACGADEHADNVASAGAFCGGNDPKYARRVCAPGLTCCAPYAAMDVAGTCVDASDPNACDTEATSTANRPPIPVLVETCDALDDDLDGVVDQNAVCNRACGADVVAAAAKALRLPRQGDQTVVEGSGIAPQLFAFSEMPEFCSTPTPSIDPDDITIGCGQVVTHPGGTLRAKAIRIAPGGSLRIKGTSELYATDVLVCPGATIQAGGEPSRDADGEAGHDLALVADQLVLLGTMFGSGGFTAVPDKRGGDGARFDIHLRRLLLAGLLDTATPAPKGTNGGDGGSVNLIVDDESFFSGTLRSGNATVKLPVCCHE